MNKRSNIMWGLIFILIAIFIIFHQMGFLETVGLPSLIVTILLVPVFVTSIIHVNFSGILFPLAIAGILYDDILGIQNLTPWPILLIALFLSIGLSFLFPHHKRWHDKKKWEGFDTIINEPDDSDVNLIAKFSGSIKYVNTDQLKRTNIDCSFGGLKVYFDHAQLAEDTGIIDVKLNFGGIELYIPKSWKVIDRVDFIVGGLEEKGPVPERSEKTIFLTGTCKFSGITIIYV